MEKEYQLLQEQISHIQSRYEEKIEELSLLRQMGSALLQVRRFEDACLRILDVILSGTVAQNCSIMLLDREKDRLFLVCATNPEKQCYVLESGRVLSREGVQYGLKLGVGAAGTALSEKRPVLINDARQSNVFVFDPKSRVEVGSLLSVPLVVEGEPFGVLNLSHSGNNVFAPNDVQLFNVLSNFVALALQSALYYEKLLNSEAKYRTLVENSWDGIAVIQGDKHLYANPRYQDLTGFNMKELEGTAFSSFMDQGGGSAGVRKDALADMNFESLPFEATLLVKGRRRLDAELHASSFVYEGKHASIVTLRDLTLRKELERRLINAQKMEAVGTLAGGVAHDLNNVLSGLVGYPELVLMQIPEEHPLRDLILTIKRSGEKAAAIVSDLLTLARRGSVTMEVVNLNHIASEFLNSPECQRILSYHPGVCIKTELDPLLSNIMGSPIHLHKTVMNVLSNAAEAMPDGGTITISTQNRLLREPMRGHEKVQEGNYAVLTVRDTGIGVSPADLERIFEPFYTKKKLGRSGTGLGMTVVWGTVKEHKGYIDIQSAPGSGTSVYLFFPVTAGVAKEREISPPLDVFRGNGESILVVDDSREQRDLAATMLRELGYKVSTVSSGREALRFLQRQPMDLILLDMIMDPGMDGLETYRALCETWPRQKALIVSGFAETERVREAQELGAGKFIRKPYKLEQLARAVRRELDENISTTTQTPTPSPQSGST